MMTKKGGSSWRWAARGLSALAIVAVAATSVQPAAAEDKSDFKAYLPGVPDTAWVVVQWQNTATGEWTTVNGWQGNVDYENNGRPYKEWAVTGDSYGDGPFRWLIYTAPGGAVWGQSQPFNMPDGSGQALVMTVIAGAQGATGGSGGATTDAAGASGELSAWQETWTYSSEGRNDARITLIAVGASPATFVGVQWLDPSGVWRNVPGWQGMIDVDASGLPYKQWGVASDNLGQGTFRWTFASALGTPITAYSPSFALPASSGEDLRMHVQVVP